MKLKNVKIKRNTRRWEEKPCVRGGEEISGK